MPLWNGQPRRALAQAGASSYEDLFLQTDGRGNPARLDCAAGPATKAAGPPFDVSP